MELTYTLIAACAIAATSLSGVVFTTRYGGAFIARYNHLLLAFALGVLCVTAYSLAGEGLEHFEANPFNFYIGAALGVGLLYISSRVLHAHHHHAAHDGHTHSRIDGSHVLISDGVHNISDGLILYPAFLAGPFVGLATAFGILIHETIQEMAEFSILKEAGYTTREALVRNFLSACTIFIGIALSLFATSHEVLEPWIFAIAFGAFAYLIIVDIVPCVFFHQPSLHAAVPYIIATLFGASMMLGVGALFPHEHEESHVETHAEHALDEHAK
jgi:zinc and cadmium transporter